MTDARRLAATLVDRAMEATIAPSFTNAGSWVRSRLDDWRDLDTYDLSGRTIVVTGATSGLGRAAAQQLARCGATVIAVGRDETRLDSLAAELGDRLVPERADLSDLDAVADLADRLVRGPHAVDTILHNAGALLADRRESPQGIEVTVASQVVAPFLLTHRLVEELGPDASARDGRVLRLVTMSSGGMYSAPLTVVGLQMSPESYDGTRQYALAKRAQVTLNEMWAERTDPDVAWFGAVHPGWADTPGVAEALPTFKKIVGPALRSPEDGADTAVWLCADDEVLGRSGEFWHDRRVRPIHRLPSTRRTDTPERRERLWSWVAGAAGVV